MKVYLTIRDVTRKECWWLPETVSMGTTLYHRQDVYGIVSKDGYPVARKPKGGAYFEIPKDAVIDYPGGTP